MIVTRSFDHGGLALLCFVSLLSLGACASSQTPVQTKPSQASKSKPARHEHNLENPDQSLGDAVQAPLEDLNLKRVQIPRILIDAENDPYDMRGLDNCRAIANEVRRLDEVLGEDFDEAPVPDERSGVQKGGDVAKKGGISAVRGAAQHLLPFSGIFRQLTGAAAHDKEVQRAIKAGNDRRAFLKGVGMNRNCAPPAAPSWFVPRSNPPKRR